MKITSFATLLLVVPSVVFGAERSLESRVSVNRVSYAGSRMPSMAISTNGASASVKTPIKNSVAVSGKPSVPNNPSDDGDDDSGNGTTDDKEDITPEQCRENYRACMDAFCMLDESEGYRCACSSNIEKSKSLIQEIQDIQLEADKLYTEGVEREQLGAKAKLVFGESEAAKNSSALSGISFTDWLNSGLDDGEGSLGDDSDIGDGLYSMAVEACQAELDACGSRAKMEELLYSRQIVADCKGFETYLREQKVNAQANKRTAESAVRKARLEMLDTTNKYNRGECLLAYKACIADKGGCGVNFENCLDASLLERRSHACENVLEQCMASREYVLDDWADESEMILVEAAKYSDKNQRLTCMAKIQACLEDGCATETNSACLTDVNVAAGICPIIDECDALVPGIKVAVNDKLGYLRTQFCQNDIDACLMDKCGVNFNAPECVGKSALEIAELCPQNMFPSCKNETQFNIILQATLLRMDYQMMQGCVNYFGEQLGRVCGTDMSCLPADMTVEGLTEMPEDGEEIIALRNQVIANSQVAVNQFFTQFENDITVDACKDSQKPTGSASLGDSVFNSAKMIARISAENRALRALETKIAELSRKQDLKKAEENCYALYKVENPQDDEEAEDGKKKTTNSYSYIRSVVFEPELRNCHVCRMQRVCETGGETKGSSALKSAAGGLSGGAAMGTMVSPGWGTAIGGIVGAVGAGIGGYLAGGQEEFCQEIESCEDVNM